MGGSKKQEQSPWGRGHQGLLRGLSRQGLAARSSPNPNLERTARGTRDSPNPGQFLGTGMGQGQMGYWHTADQGRTTGKLEITVSGMLLGKS